MRIAVTSEGTSMSSPVDPRLGRAACFVVVDTESGDYTAVDNSANLNAIQGAGIQAGRLISELGVKVLLTGQVGPKAAATLRAAGVKVYTGATGTVSEAVAQYMAGTLKRAASSEVEEYWN
jgi:predicted Fe-Mo cluster-binding NifX family protein